MSDRTPVQSLSPANITATARHIDWSAAGGEFGEDLQYWQSFTYEIDGTDFELVASGGSVVAVKLDDLMYDDSEYDVYADRHNDDGGNLLPGAIEESVFDELFAAEPYLSGAEGPMMNFFYPLTSLRSRSEAAVATQLHNMCLVCVDGEYGLALTGGGMDMTWYIVMSYVDLGYLPPVDFCNVPYDIDAESMQYLGAAMVRSLQTLQGRLQNQRDSLERRIPGVDTWSL